MSGTTEPAGATRPPSAGLPRSPRDVALFARHRDAAIHEWVRILMLLPTVLVPVFLLLDSFMVPPELMRRFVLYRAIATGFALAEYLLLRFTKPRPHAAIHGYVSCAVVGASIVAMTVSLGGFASGYYVGLMLVLVAVNLVLPWQMHHSLLNGLMLLGMYVAANLLWGPSPDFGALLNNLYFLGAMLLISVVITQIRYRLVEREFWLRHDLLNANEDLTRSREEVRQARDALWGEMEVAKRIQTALLPANRDLGHFRVAALMKPAAEVGGDYYDLVTSRYGEHWVALGDVSGHGVEAGLVMMMAQSTILAVANERSDITPSEIFCAVNRVLTENVHRLGSSKYMTLNVIRVRGDHLTVSGKHQDLLVHRAGTGRVETVENDGTWAGIAPDVSSVVSDLDVVLGVGDTVLLFTDGVTEAEGVDGELYSQPRLVEVFGLVAQLEPDALLEAVRRDVESFAPVQHDDVTLLALRRLA